MSGDKPAVVVGIGASAGGVEALTKLVAALPARLDAAILVVLHVPSTGTSVLASILDRAGPLPAVTAVDGTRLVAGTVHVAPPDRHLVVEDGVVRLTAGPRVNGHRPAVDPLLTSLSARDGDAVGVLLSGTRDDGTFGMLSIKAAGGTTLVQDPEEALFDGMIRNAMRHVDIDAILDTTQLADRLVALASASGREAAEDDGAVMNEHDRHMETSPDDDRTATRYTCPDCGGALWRHADTAVVTFRCSVGHAYSPSSFDGEQSREIESALWAAARLLGDRRTLLEEMADSARTKGHERSAVAFTEQALEADAAAEVIRNLIEGGRLPLGGAGDADAAA